MSDEPSVTVHSNSNEEEEVEEDSGNNNSNSIDVNVEPDSNESTGGSGNNRTSESDLGKGVSSIISTLITDFDSRAQQTILSQDQLSFSIDRLTGGYYPIQLLLNTYISTSCLCFWFDYLYVCVYIYSCFR